jgi:hypothetical protein
MILPKSACCAEVATTASRFTNCVHTSQKEKPGELETGEMWCEQRDFGDDLRTRKLVERSLKEVRIRNLNMSSFWIQGAIFPTRAVGLSNKEAVVERP